MQFRSSRHSRPGLDLTPLRAVSMSITPLVDTMLNLLIFVLLLGALTFQSAIRVRLPEAATQNEEAKQELMVVLTSDDRLYLNDDPVEVAQLGARLREQLRDRNEAVVIIRADTAVSHGRVVEVMDIAKTAGAARLAIATEPKGTRPEGRSP
jgi:biopolymer transport protein ExbD